MLQEAATLLIGIDLHQHINMSVSNKFIPGFDLPIYEYLRPTFLANAIGSANTVIFNVADGTSPLFYSFRQGGFWNYNAMTDSWAPLTSPPQTTDTLPAATMSNRCHTGQVVFGTLSSVYIAANDNNRALIGKKIRITHGPGRYQERTIVDLIGPIEYDSGAIVSVTNSAGANAGTISISLAGTTFRGNTTSGEFNGMEAKIISNVTGYAQIRKILYNDINSNGPVLGDPRLAGRLKFWCPQFTTPSTGAVIIIQYSEAILDRPWNVVPTGNSYYEIIDNNEFNTAYVLNNANNPFSFWSYDVFTGVWYYRTVINLRSGQFTTDYALENIFEAEYPLLKSSITLATSSTFTDTTTAFGNNFNYCKISILSGTGAYQTRTILSGGPVLNPSLSGTAVVVPNWDILPDSTSKYVIQNNDSNMFLIGNTEARLHRYNIEDDYWSNSPVTLETGWVRSIYVTTPELDQGYGPIPVTSVNRVTSQFGTIICAIPHQLRTSCWGIGQSITATLCGAGGATASIYNGDLSVYNGGIGDRLGINFTVDPGANLTPLFTNSTTVIHDLAKKWTPNQWAGNLLMVANGAQTTQAPTVAIRFIIGNGVESLSADSSFGFTPANGSRYWILPLESLGNDTYFTNLTAGSASFSYGKLTSNVSAGTSLVDNTKRWITNCHANKRYIIVAGTGTGTEGTISSNTRDTLTVSSAVTLDTTSVYCIIGNFASAGGMLLKHAANSTVDTGKYIYYHQGGNNVPFLSRYNIPLNTWEQSILTPPLIGTGTTSTGQCVGYDFKDKIYFNLGNNSRAVFYIDLNKRTTYAAGFFPYASSNSAYTGLKYMPIYKTSTGVKFIYYYRGGNTTDSYRQSL